MTVLVMLRCPRSSEAPHLIDPTVDIDWSRPCISHSADPDEVTTTLDGVNLDASVVAERAAMAESVVSGGVRSVSYAGGSDRLPSSDLMTHRRCGNPRGALCDYQA
jgi:hypothetical protein